MNAVGLRLGASPPESVERRMTLERIELEWHWLQRSRSRDQRIDQRTIEYSVKRAGYWLLKGEDLN